MSRLVPGTPSQLTPTMWKYEEPSVAVCVEFPESHRVSAPVKAWAGA